MDFFWRANLSSLSQKDCQKGAVTFSDICLRLEQLLAICEELPEVEIGSSPGAGLARFCDVLLAGGCGSHVVKMLEKGCLAYNRRFKSPNGVEYSLFHLACACGDERVVRYYKEKGTHKELRSEQDSYGQTAKDIFSKKSSSPTMSALRWDGLVRLTEDPACFYSFVRKLHMHEVNVNEAVNEDDDTLVHLVIGGGASFLPHLLMLVGRWGAAADAPNKQGFTPLCVAARSGSDGLAEALICLFGCDPNYTNDRDSLRTPLHYAAQAGACQVVEVLLRRGAEPGREIVENDISLTPEELARKEGHTEVAERIARACLLRADTLTERLAEGELDLGDLQSSDYFATNSGTRTLLMEAVRCNRPRTATALLKHSSKDFRNSESQQTMVSIACQHNHCDCLKVLLRNGCSSHLAIRDWSGQLPIDYVTEHGCEECVRSIVEDPLGLVGLNRFASSPASVPHGVAALLLRGRDKRQRNVVTPALFEAAETGSLDTIDRIYEEGDDISPRNKTVQAESPLAVAIRCGHIEVIKWLEERGADLSAELDGNPRDGFNTCLHSAARGGGAATVAHVLRCLLGRGALLGAGAGAARKINERNRSGATAIELAAAQGHREVVQLLESSGASTCVPDSRSGGLLSCGAFEGVRYELERLRLQHLDDVLRAVRAGSLSEVKSVWQDPYDHNLRTAGGETVVMVAAGCSSSAVVEFLLSSLKNETVRQPAAVILSFAPTDEGSVLGSYLMERDAKKGRTALHYAVLHRRRDNAEQILKHDSSCVDLTDRDDNTALHMAAMAHDKKMLKTLMAYNASLCLLNRSQQFSDQLVHKNASLRRHMEELRSLQCSAH